MRFLAVILGTCFLAAAVRAQPDPSGIEFVTVGDPGNPAWTGGGSNNGRGAVDYEFRIGKFEVTTAQWAEFMNAALDRPSADRIPHVFAPSQWGAVGATPQNPGGQRFTVPAGREMIPTGGVDWRTSAIFCNWLHNGKGTSRESFLSGAYDVSTFGYFMGGSTFTDQIIRSPGARYYIPSLDEWMKAAHWSPDRNGSGQGGWYLYSNSSDDPYTYAPPPGMGHGGTANAVWGDFSYPGLSPYNVPLGAYVGVTSPWGLYDAAGGTSEWTEGVFQIPDEMFPRSRFYEGSAWGFGASFSDHARSPGGSIFPSYSGSDMGLRIAAVVPNPASLMMVLPGMLAIVTRRTRAIRCGSIVDNSSPRTPT
jgi:formylglycine-generating enzyme required for sulfatase activity